MKKNDLPEKLKDLVSWSVALLGQSIKEEYGQDFYRQVESTRRQMKKLRSGTVDSWKKDVRLLKKQYDELSGLNTGERFAFSHSFTCMLELINRCESAYRTYRLSDRDLAVEPKGDNSIIFVLTAHPTEARGPDFLEVYERITALLVEALKSGTEAVEKRLYHLLRIVLKVPIARNEKPQVSDEAQNIFNFSLKQEMLELMVRTKQSGTNVMLRTWVGGDKDGHPGVDENSMIESFNLSRGSLLIYIRRKLHQVRFELSVMDGISDLENLEERFAEIDEKVKSLVSVSDGDGQRVVDFRVLVNEFKISYEAEVKFESAALRDVLDLVWLFPGLVLPLEVREDSELVRESLNNPDEFAIGRMLKTLDDVARGNHPKWYVRGFVLSMCEAKEDILAGIKLTEKVLKEQFLPVVPLFETEKALANGAQILSDLFNQHKELVKRHKDKWGSRFEVMLGYSDSSKESGVFPSRLLISKGMTEIDKSISKFGLTSVFFHGSGGSVERGGGSIQEQTQWWPKSAISIFKATIQGEMVARSFASPEIFAGQIKKISQQWKVKRGKKTPAETAKIMEKFSKSIQKNTKHQLEMKAF